MGLSFLFVEAISKDLGEFLVIARAEICSVYAIEAWYFLQSKRNGNDVTSAIGARINLFFSFGNFLGILEK
jgi:hypothetical protein